MAIGTTHSRLNRGMERGARCLQEAKKVDSRHTASQLYVRSVQLHLPRIAEVKELLCLPSTWMPRRDGLIAHKRYAWFVFLPRNFVVQEMCKSTCTDLMLKCIGNVPSISSCITCNVVWNCRGQPMDSNPMRDAAKR
eukprot:4573335-Amphidinium_carterae.3